MFTKRFQGVGEIERKRIVMPAHVEMRLNRLEKPEPWPTALLESVRVNELLDTLQQYPAYQPFYEKLAAFVGVEPHEIVIGAGIEEFIRTLFMLCIEPGDKVAFLWPTCAMFEVYAGVFGADVMRIVATPGEYLSDAELIDQLPADLKLLILVNPGQPVETCFGYGAVLNIARACEERGAVIAIDEAYHGCGAPTMIGTHRHHPNMAVLRTFSKAFGAASIRLGYAVGGPEMIGALNAVRQSGEVSGFSMHVANMLIDNFERQVQPSISDICRARDTLRDRVKRELGLQAWGQWANHVLIAFESEPQRNGVRLRLGIKDILTKANFPAPLDRHMLVTCGSSALMDRFFVELKAAL